MLQEIIVYIILIATALHVLQQTIVFFKPAKANKFGSSCASGSCSNCSLKFDVNSIHPDQTSHAVIKSKHIQI